MMKMKKWYKDGRMKKSKNMCLKNYLKREGIVDHFVRNFVKQNGMDIVYFFQTRKMNQNAIHSAFRWDYTPEGINFWYNHHSKFKKYCNEMKKAQNSRGSLDPLLTEEPQSLRCIESIKKLLEKYGEAYGDKIVHKFEPSNSNYDAIYDYYIYTNIYKGWNGLMCNCIHIEVSGTETSTSICTKQPLIVFNGDIVESIHRQLQELIKNDYLLNS